MGRIATLMVLSLVLLGGSGCSESLRNENMEIATGPGPGATNQVPQTKPQGTAMNLPANGGGLLGGYIGKSLDSSDNATMYNTLEKNATNQPTAWNNATTGASYKITPISKRLTIHGNHNCRRFYLTAELKKRTQQLHGVACLQPDGSWETVNP
ncbi:MAG: RT0821/Lpp0805 family surface protein [Gammaproteobacteria bacterium]